MKNTKFSLLVLLLLLPSVMMAQLQRSEGVRMLLMLALPFAALYFFFGEFFLRLFMEEPSRDALHTGITLLRILAPFYFVISLKMVADGVLRGAGMMHYFMIGTFTDLVLRVVLAIVLSRTSLGSTGIWTAWPIGWCTATVLCVLFYRREFIKKPRLQLPPSD